MFQITATGDWKKTFSFLQRSVNSDIYRDLERYGQMGVEALAKSTPVRSGETSRSWAYRIVKDRKGPTIEWYNTNVVPGGTSVAILIQYGHGTGTGGYVSGIDYINPAMRPLFEKIADEIWKKVTS